MYASSTELVPRDTLSIQILLLISKALGVPNFLRWNLIVSPNKKGLHTTPKETWLNQYVSKLLSVTFKFHKFLNQRNLVTSLSASCIPTCLLNYALFNLTLYNIIIFLNKEIWISLKVPCQRPYSPNDNIQINRGVRVLTFPRPCNLVPSVLVTYQLIELF